MPRSIARFAFPLAIFVCASALSAETVVTRCVEKEVVLDSLHSSARLERCGGSASEPLLWHLDRIDQAVSPLDGTYDPLNGGAGSVIYVMDTGVMASHVEFATSSGTRVLAGYDATGSVEIGRSRCTTENKATAPCFESFEELSAASHGTSVASIAAGQNVGVAPQASVVSIRVMNERGLATTRTYLEGLEAIVAHAWSSDAPYFRTAVVNISGWVLERLGAASAPPSSAPPVAFATVEQKMREMIAGIDAAGRPDRLHGKRFLFVVAANNLDGGCGPAGVIDRFPATLGPKIEGLITVGGMTATNTSWSGSCRGGVEVLAPAQQIFSATITANDHYRGRRPNLRSGTSFAAPIIAGIAARLLSDRPDMTPQQLEWWITATPSRIDDASAPFADGKVAFVQSIAPKMGGASPVTSTRAALEP